MCVTYVFSECWKETSVYARKIWLSYNTQEFDRNNVYLSGDNWNGHGQHL